MEPDRITRPEREEFAHLLCGRGCSQICGIVSRGDFMATEVSAHRVPQANAGAGTRLAFSSRYAYDGSAGVDRLSQAVALMPDESGGSWAMAARIERRSCPRSN